MTWRTVPILGVALVALASMMFAQEQEVERSAVPSAVLKALAARYPQASIGRIEKENEDGKTTYEVQVDLDGKRSEMSFSPDGELLVEEETIDFGDMPEAVRRSLASTRYAKAEVKRVERVMEADKANAPTFEIVVEQKGETHELVFESTGELKKDEKVSSAK